jgi:hypothetical protein
MNDQIASIPRLPRLLRNSWPIGKGSWVDSSSEMEELANEAAMNNIQPRDVVNPTDTSMAIGAARAAPATSSEI